MKTRIDDLAIFGNAPDFTRKLHVGCPNLGDQERFFSRAKRMMDTNWLTNNGPFVGEFEQRIAEYACVKHCIAICNATMALQIAIRALDLSGEVIVPSFTFIATAHALQWEEITPVFCDIGPATHHIDPNKIESLITPLTSGIIGVHLWGQPCDVDAISDISKRHDLKLLFDASHAFGCSHKGKMIGGNGHAEIFSFHATKFLNTFEGGAVVTNDDILAKKIRLMKNFGFSGYDNVICIGTNGKMTEICAAMGLTSLESVNEIISVNFRNYKQYKREFEGLPGVKVVSYNESEKCNYHYIVIEIDSKLAGISRDQLQNVLWAENVIARRYFYPGCHNMEPYRSCFPQAKLSLPETERLADKVILLPTGTSIGGDDIKKVCQIIRLVMTNGEKAVRRLSMFAPK